MAQTLSNSTLAALYYGPSVQGPAPNRGAVLPVPVPVCIRVRNEACVGIFDYGSLRRIQRTTISTEWECLARSTPEASETLEGLRSIHSRTNNPLSLRSIGGDVAEQAHRFVRDTNLTGGISVR